MRYVDLQGVTVCPMTMTRLRRDENGSLKIKTMTKSILTFVDETRRKCWWLTNSTFPFRRIIGSRDFV